MRKAAIFVALALLLVLSAAPALAANGPPSLPHAFYGTVTVNGALAADGTQVSATVDVDDGTVITNAQNPVTTVGGSYGVDSPRLLVQGDITPGATITFHVTNVNGTATGGTDTFIAGGGPTAENLTVTIAEPASIPGPSGGGGGAPAAQAPIQVDVFGMTTTLEIDSDGVVQETFTATSADGKLTITIEEGTIALDKDGEPLSSLTTDVDPSPPDPPEGGNIIGLAYDFGPDGATFEPPITFAWSYDPDALPEGVAEEDLVIAYYDEDAGEWVELDCVVDTENDTITASVSHFTTFAIISAVSPLIQEYEATLAELEAAKAQAEIELAAAQAKVASLQDNVAAAQAKVASLQSDLSAAQARQAAAQDEVARLEAARGPSWWLIGGIIAAVVVVAGLILYLLQRRRAA